MKKDKREIKLDPMEWRDAMREVKEKAKPAPGKSKKGGKAGGKKSKGR